MEYSTTAAAKKLFSMAEENKFNVLEIQLRDDRSIGARGRTFIKVRTVSEDYIIGYNLEFYQEKEDLIPEHADYHLGDERSFFGAAQKYWINVNDIATATPKNMLSNAEEIE